MRHDESMATKAEVDQKLRDSFATHADQGRVISFRENEDQARFDGIGDYGSYLLKSSHPFVQGTQAATPSVIRRSLI